MPKAPQEDSYFIQKLYQTIQVTSIITQHSSHEVVVWDLTGKSFIVNDERAFTCTVLASEFGIGRFDSFARKVRVGLIQLNKYGFRRSKVQGNRVRFFHKEFNRDGKQKFIQSDYQIKFGSQVKKKPYQNTSNYN